MEKSTIFLLSLTLSISVASIHAKNVVQLKKFTKTETGCTEKPVETVACECAASGSSPDNWIFHEDITEIPFGADHYRYEFYQMSKVITELSTDGFILLSDKYDCPSGVEKCIVKFDESNKFSVTSNYNKISRMNVHEWNNFLRKSSLPKPSTVWYECVFKPNTTGYLAIRPMVEKVLGWTYKQSCTTAVCWPGFHPCSVCPKKGHASQEDCVWLGKAPKINPTDNTIDGERRCVVAENEDALRELNDSDGKHLFLPRKYEILS